MASSPVPTKDPELLTWLPRFSGGLDTHGGELGLSPATVTSAKNDCAALLFEIQHRISGAKNYSREVHAYRDLIKNGEGQPASPPPVLEPLPTPPTAVEPGVLPRLRRLVQVIKNLETYNEPIGADLDILTSGDDSGGVAPAVSLVSATAEGTTLKWTKDGMDGVKVQSRKPGEVTWTDLGTDLFSPFVDTRPLATPGVPETMEYRMCHLDGDTPTNVWSQVLVVTRVP